MRYKREFGVPEDMAQDNFTDPDGRIMKRAGGGPDDSYSAQAAVDDEAHIIVAAALTNNASDTGELPVMLQALMTKEPRSDLCSAPAPGHEQPMAAVRYWAAERGHRLRQGGKSQSAPTDIAHLVS